VRPAGRFCAAVLVAAAATGCRDGAARSTTPAAGTAPGGGTGSAATAVESPAGPTLASVAMATSRARERQPRFVASFGRQGTADGELTLPFDVAVAPDGSLYVSDTTGVQRFTTDGTFLYRVDPGELAQARGVAVGPDGRLYVAGFGAAVRVYDDQGRRLADLGSPGDGPGHFAQPVDMTVETSGSVIVVDRGNRTVQRFAADGRYLGTIGAGGGGRGQFSVPWSVAVGPSGDVFVSSADDYLIQRYAPDGTFKSTLGRSHASDIVWQTAGLSFDEAGYLYCLQVPAQLIQSYDVEADPPSLRWEFGGLGAGPGQFSAPSGMTVVGRTIWVADTSNHRVQQLELAPEN
jgi:tripartite motif-containing protein 71